MRYFGLALVSSALVLGACGGDKGNAGDSAAAADSATQNAAAMPAAGAAETVPAAPATGTVHEVKMLVTPAGEYRFDPANITVKQGDAIKWVMVSGGPHNVQFDEASVPAAGKAQLRANMPNQATELGSPMFMNPNETYQVSFANVAPGTYNYHCTPHLAMGMTGVVTVQ